MLTIWGRYYKGAPLEAIKDCYDLAEARCLADKLALRGWLDVQVLPADVYEEVKP